MKAAATSWVWQIYEDQEELKIHLENAKKDYSDALTVAIGEA